MAQQYSIYLFLRTAAKRVGVTTGYKYMGRLKYLVHDRDREKPVYFTWQILDWPLPIEGQERMDLRLEGESNPAESQDLAERVVHVSLIEGDGAGYDVKSYTEQGQERFIEVKTTRGGACTACYVSVNEVCFAAEHADSYYLYRIYDFDEVARSGDLFVQRGALESAFDLTAIQFRVAVGV